MRGWAGWRSCNRNANRRDGDTRRKCRGTETPMTGSVIEAVSSLLERARRERNPRALGRGLRIQPGTLKRPAPQAGAHCIPRADSGEKNQVAFSQPALADGVAGG